MAKVEVRVSERHVNDLRESLQLAKQVHGWPLPLSAKLRCPTAFGSNAHSQNTSHALQADS
jgi:hypothetical protein